MGMIVAWPHLHVGQVVEAALRARLCSSSSVQAFGQLRAYIRQSSAVQQGVVQVQHQQQALRCQNPGQVLLPQAPCLTMTDLQAHVNVPARDGVKGGGALILSNFVS